MEALSRLDLARTFAYSAKERASLIDLVEGIASRHCEFVDDAEEIAREYLLEYVRYPKTGKAARRQHYRAVAKAAAALHRLLDDPAALEGGSASYLVNDLSAGWEGFGSTVRNTREFNRAVMMLAQRAEEWGTTGYLPGTEPGAEDVPRWVTDGNNNVRTRMADAQIVLYGKVTGLAPTVTANGPAATWLRMTINPAMRFARLELEEERARELTDNGALETIATVRASQP